MFKYQLFGQDVASEIACPGLMAALGEPGVSIRFGATPERLAQPAGGGICYTAAPGEALIALPNIGRFHVRDGDEIVMHPAGGATEGLMRLFLLNLAFGVLLHQRGELALHAAAVETDGECIVVAGESGAGKSTIAAGLLARGWRVLTDEICVVRDEPGVGPVVIPGPPYLQIWADALRHNRHDAARLEPVRPGMQKYYLPLGPGHSNCGAPLRAIYVVSPWNGDNVQAEALSGQHRFEALIRNTFRFEYLHPMGLDASHFDRIFKLAQQVPAVCMRRPQSSHSIGQVLDFLVADAGRFVHAGGEALKGMNV